MNKPLYIHDCDKCVFLGTTERDHNHEVPLDLYLCHSALNGYTVIARWSDAGPDYMSGAIFGTCSPALAIATVRAIALDLITDDDVKESCKSWADYYISAVKDKLL